MGKNAGTTQTYYGSIAGMLGIGQLDFIWGVMQNNAIVWPDNLLLWDQRNWNAGTQILYVDGNVYRTAGKTDLDPPAFPWVLYAPAYAAGAYNIGDLVVRNGNVWQNTIAANAAAPGAVKPGTPADGRGTPISPAPAMVNGWKYISTPATWTGSGFHWPINSIVAWEGRIYTTGVSTAAEPPAAPWQLWRIMRATSPNPLKITIPSRGNGATGGGDCYLYWGTPNQTLDAVNEQTLHALGHPPYRNCPLWVLHNYPFGQNTVTPPDFTILGGRWPVQSLIVGAATAEDNDWQINPWVFLAEALTHPVWGLGLPDAIFDAATWQAEADRCYANPSLHYISPVYTQQKKIRDLVSDLLGYPDAFIFWNALALLTAGHWPHDQAPPVFTNDSLINRDKVIKEFSSTSDGWDGTANLIELSFRDIQAAFSSRPVFAPNLFNRTITRKILEQKLDRPHIVRAAQAQQWATEAARISGDRVNKVTLEIKRASAPDVIPGALFELTDDVLGTTDIMRCTGHVISAPPTETRKITCETERGLGQLPYSATPPNPSAAPGSVPEPVQNFQFVQLPSQLGFDPNTLACLAARSDSVTNSLQIWFRDTDANAYQLLATTRNFAVAGLVQESIDTQNQTDAFNAVVVGNTYNLSKQNVWNESVNCVHGGGGPFGCTAGVDYQLDAIAGTITILAGGAISNGDNITVDYAWSTLVLEMPDTPVADIESISASLTADQIADRALLLFLVQAADAHLFEICSVSAVTAVTGGHRLALVRGLYGTKLGGDGVHTWDLNDIGMIIYRANIVPLNHASFADLQANGGTANFILAPGSPFGQADITDIFDPASNPRGLATSCQYQYADIFSPKLAWTLINHLVSGAWTPITDLSITYLPTDSFQLAFQITSADASLIDARLVARQGSNETQLWSDHWSPTAQVTRQTTFQLPIGTYDIVLIARDAQNRVAEISLPVLTGSDLLTIQAAAPTVVVPPVANPSSDTMLRQTHANVTITCATAGSTVYYKILGPGAPVPATIAQGGSGWTAGGAGTASAGPFYLYWGTGEALLYCYAIKAGLTDSQVASFDYSYDSGA